MKKVFLYHPYVLNMFYDGNFVHVFDIWFSVTDVLEQVFHIVGHLVYWGKATIIYPLCETNVYVLSPVANTYM